MQQDRQVADAKDRGRILTPRRRLVRPPTLSLPRSASVKFLKPLSSAKVEQEISSGSIWSVAARRGRRRTSREDMYAVHPMMDESKCISLYAVFDGHGGAKAAQYASKRLPNLFLKAYQSMQNADQALEHAFLKTDDELIKQFSRSSELVDIVNSSPELERTLSGGSALGVVTLQGARGRKSSDVLQKKLTRKRISGLSMSPKAFLDAVLPLGMLKRTKSKADEQLSTIPVKSSRGCGTTATVIAFIGDMCSIANVGDSRAVLYSEHSGVTRLCKDHRPGDPDEQARIESRGGLVIKVSGTFRVNGVLAVSRAIGDMELKEFVIANPDVTSFPLKGGVGFVIIASDGIWDILSDEECVNVVKKRMEKGDEDNAAKGLIEYAWDRGSSDDMCVVVVNVGKYMASYGKGNDNGNGKDMKMKYKMEVEDEVLPDPAPTPRYRPKGNDW